MFIFITVSVVASGILHIGSTPGKSGYTGPCYLQDLIALEQIQKCLYLTLVSGALDYH